MNKQMMSLKRSAGLESRQGTFNEATYRDIHTRFMRQSAHYLDLATRDIEGYLIPCKARAH